MIFAFTKNWKNSIHQPMSKGNKIISFLFKAGGDEKIQKEYQLN